MEVERSALAKALTALKPAYKSGSANAGLVTYLSDERAFIAHSDEIIVRYPFDLGSRSATFNADKVLALLSRLEAKSVNVDVEDAELIIKTRTAKSGIPTRNPEEYKTFHQVTFPEESRLIPVPSDFVEGLKFTVISCAKDMVVPVLTCVQIKSDAMLSCDQYRVSLWKMKSKIKAPGFKETLLPASSVKEVLNYQLSKVGFDEQWVHFVAEDGALLSCYSYAEEVPDLTQLFDLGEGSFLMEWPKEVLPSLKRAEVFTDAEDRTAKITINKGLMKIQSHSDEGWYEEKLAAVVKEKDRAVKTSFTISLAHLQDILSRNVPIVIGERRVLFEGPNWKHVISTYYVGD